MKTNGIKQRLAKNEPCFVTTLHLCDPFVYELASSLGVEGIWLDMEHRPFNLETTQRLMTAARAGGNSDVIVRTSRHEFSLVTRVLECGAQGIIYPRCNDAEEARQVVRAAKFAPLGVRGCDGWGRDAPFGQMPLHDYIRSANEQTLVVIQIETPEALENAAAIAAVDGVDVLMFGPGDFSVLSGVPGQVRHEKVLDASRRVCAAALAAGKHFSQPAASIEAAEELIAMGARLLFHDADVLMINRCVRTMLDQLAGLRKKLGYK
jgi:4-hydroxy-2-oxoheptanedioate aldolase